MKPLAAGLDIPNQPSTIFKDSDTFLGLLTSQVLYYGIIIAAFYFFVRVLIGGFGLLSSGGDPAKIQAGQQSITHALVGLVIVVAAYFIAQLLKAIFGLDIPLT